MTQDETHRDESVRPPRQDRSARTLERILEATERLLEVKRFEELTVAEIVREARSSVGAFYARFTDKEALLDALDQRYMEEALAEMDVMLPADAARPEAVVRQVVEGLLAFHRRKPGLIRALVLRARTEPDRRYQERGDELTAKGFGRVADLLRPHARSDRAIGIGYLAVLTVVREAVLFPEGPAKGLKLSDDELADELTELFMAYVGKGGEA